MQYTIGFTATYIQDHPFDHYCDLPVGAAVAWVRQACPEQFMGTRFQAKDLTQDGYGWLNKLFIIVGVAHGQYVALVNWDGHFSIYTQR